MIVNCLKLVGMLALPAILLIAVACGGDGATEAPGPHDATGHNRGGGDFRSGLHRRGSGDAGTTTDTAGAFADPGDCCPR